MRFLSLAPFLLITPWAEASVSVITKVRCELEFPFDSTQANSQQLEACLQKMKLSTVLPDHLAIYASASPPGTPAYNFELSKRRSKAISKILSQEFPKAEQEFFAGGVNPEQGQKAIVVASISSSEPIFLKQQAPKSGFLSMHRMEAQFGPHRLRDNKAQYKALGVGIAGRTLSFMGQNVELAAQALSLQAEDYYDEYALGLDIGPVFSWKSLDVVPKFMLRSLSNTQGTNALDAGLRLTTIYNMGSLTTSVSLSQSSESQEVLAAFGRAF